MSPQEMALVCTLSLQSGDGYVTFVVPGAPTRRGLVRLSGPHSPKGELLCINCDKEMVARFDALDVLAWMAANELVKVSVKPS